MGYIDKIRGRAAGLARDKGDTIGQKVDKAAEAINRRTEGKHADKVSKFAQGAKRKVNELAEERPEEGGSQGGSSPPAT